MLHRLGCVLVAVAVVVACGRGPTAPTQVPVIGPRHEVLEGFVIDDGTLQAVPGAAVSVHDGPNAGVATTTDPFGRFALWLEVGGFTLDVRRAGYDDFSQAVTMLPSTSTRVEIRLMRSR